MLCWFHPVWPGDETYKVLETKLGITVKDRFVCILILSKIMQWNCKGEEEGDIEEAWKEGETNCLSFARFKISGCSLFAYTNILLCLPKKDHLTGTARHWHPQGEACLWNCLLEAGNRAGDETPISCLWSPGSDSLMLVSTGIKLCREKTLITWSAHTAVIPTAIL